MPSLISLRCALYGRLYHADSEVSDQNGQMPRLMYAHAILLVCHAPAPYFSRLNGSYEALEYGFEADAFTDMTGGLAEWYNPADLRVDDFYLIRAAYQSGAVIGCLSVVRQSIQLLHSRPALSFYVIDYRY